MDAYRVMSLVMLALGVGMLIAVHLAPELLLGGAIGVSVCLFLALNYWCGFPFHGWWRRRNIWR